VARRLAFFGGQASLAGRVTFVAVLRWQLPDEA